MGDFDAAQRFVQLPDAGSPPRRAAAPHGPQFRLPVLKEDKDKSYTPNKPSTEQGINAEERSARPLPITDQRIFPLQRCPDPFDSEHLNIMPQGCLAASLRLHVASLAVLFHHGYACLSVSPSSGSGSKLYQPPSFLFSAANFSYLEAATSPVCEFLLPGGCQRHPSLAAKSHKPPRLRIPPTWRPPTPSIPSSQITPATMS